MKKSRNVKNYDNSSFNNMLQRAGLQLEDIADKLYNHSTYHWKRNLPMQTAKLFNNGRSQAVRLPAEYRFEGDEVLIRRDPVTGDVILSARNTKFEEWFKLRDKLLPLIPPEDLDALDDLRDPGAPIARGA